MEKQKEKSETVESLFEEFRKYFKQNGTNEDDIDELEDAIEDLFKKKTKPQPENPVIKEIAYAIENIFSKPNSDTIEDRLKRLHQKLTESDWKDSTDLL